MRPSRLRFTVRRMMIAIVLVAIALGIKPWMNRRSAWSRHRAEGHIAEWTRLAPTRNRVVEPRLAYHAEMSLKYGKAAERPWLPIPADPPEPLDPE
jgi:hypothetical protein